MDGNKCNKNTKMDDGLKPSGEEGEPPPPSAYVGD